MCNAKKEKEGFTLLAAQSPPGTALPTQKDMDSQRKVPGRTKSSERRSRKGRRTRVVVSSKPVHLLVECDPSRPGELALRHLDRSVLVRYRRVGDDEGRRGLDDMNRDVEVLAERLYLKSEQSIERISLVNHC